MSATKNSMKFLFILTLTLLVGACDKKTSDIEDADIIAVKSALLEVNQISLADEGGAIGTCSYGGRTCGGAGNLIKNIDWNGCTTTGAALTGSWTENYNSAPCCSAFGNGCSVTRITSTNGSVITFTGGSSISTTSENHTAYNGLAINGASGVSTVIGAGSDRTVTINGLHRIGRAANGSVWFNHSIRTAAPITLTGTRTFGSRIISGGAVEVYHNAGAYLATSTFSASDRVSWANNGCCFPTSGTITTVFSGAKVGTTSLTFLNTSCGAATYKDFNGTPSTVVLDQCE